MEAPRRELGFAAVPDATRELGRAATVGVAASAAAGLVLRFVAPSPLWLDEALSVNIAALPLGDIGAALRRDGHPPLYYWLLHLWMEVFGQGDGAVRALSGVFGVVALVLAVVVARRLGGPRAAAGAIVLMGLSPFALRYATETRMYALEMVLVLAGWLAIDAARRAPSIRRLAAVALVTGLLLLTHYWSLYLVAAVGLGVLVQAWRQRDRRPVLLRLAAAMAAGGVLFVPWIPSFLHQAAHTGTPWGPRVRPTLALAITLSDIGGLNHDGAVLGFVLVVLVLVAVFATAKGADGLEVRLRATGPVATCAAVVALTFVIGVLASFAGHSTYATRYASVFFPLVAVLAAVGAARFASERVWGGVMGVALLAALPGVIYNVHIDRTEAGRVVGDLNRLAAAGDVVVYCPDQLGPAFSRHLRADVVTTVFPTGGGPTFVDWTDYETRNRAADPEPFAAQVIAKAGATHTVWLVFSSSYRTFEGKCEALEASLEQQLGTPKMLETDDGTHYFEHANLLQFPHR